MHRLTSTTAALLGAALLGTSALPVQAETLKLSHVRPQGTAIDKDAKAFAEAVAEATGGELEVRLYPASALGDYTVVQERVGIGAVEMAVQPPASGINKRFQLVYFPYLTKSWEDAKTVFAPGSTLRQVVADLYAEENIRVLAAWPVYFGGIALNAEAEGMGDPTVEKNLKVRVPPIKSFQLLAESLGYIPSPLPFSEAFTAVQTGVVDGVIGSGAEGYYASFRDVTKYYVPMNTHFEMWYLIINEDTFQGLEEAQQQALSEAAAAFEAARWETAEAAQQADEQRLADNGTEIVEVSDADIDAAVETVRSEVWPVIVEDMGADWAQPILDQLAAE